MHHHDAKSDKEYEEVELFKNCLLDESHVMGMQTSEFSRSSCYPDGGAQGGCWLKTERSALGRRVVDSCAGEKLERLGRPGIKKYSDVFGNPGDFRRTGGGGCPGMSRHGEMR